MKLSEIPPKPPKFLFYGPFGGGKTAFAETLGKDLQLLDVDQGAITGLRFQDFHTSLRKEIDVIPFPNPGLAFTDLQSKLISIINDCNNGTYPFKAVCLDSLTSLSDVCRRQVMRNSGKTEMNIGLWGISIDQMESIVLNLRSLPIVVILVAHETSELVDNSVQKQISIYGKNLPNKIPTYFDEVLYFASRDLGGGKSAYTIQSKSSPSIPVRTRHGVSDGFQTSLGMKELLSQIGFNFDKFLSPLEAKKQRESVVPSLTSSSKEAKP